MYKVCQQIYHILVLLSETPRTLLAQGACGFIRYTLRWMIQEHKLFAMPCYGGLPLMKEINSRALNPRVAGITPSSHSQPTLQGEPESDYGE